MKKTTLILFALLCSTFSFAQTENNDTIPAKELNEIVVEGENQQTSSRKSTYIPLTRQKNSAADAVALLSQMGIPQLDVNPASKEVKTISGQPVTIFIDHLPATSQDLSGMRTSDVRKVEYLIYPTDPRFMGAQYVINFIMQKYEWGGYTKLNADKWFGVNRSEASVYSKFVYKKMTYDLYADETYLTDRHSGTRATETFRFTDLYGHGPQTVERMSEPVSSRYRSNGNNLVLRAMYNGSVPIENTLSFGNSSVPRNNSVNSLTYAGDFLPGSTAATIASERDWHIDYNLSVFAPVNNKIQLAVDLRYRYDHNSSNSDYTDSGFRIVNDAKEKSHMAQLTPIFIWNINQNNSLIAFMHGEFSSSRIDYYGNSASRQKYDIWGYTGAVKYVYQQEKWSAGCQAGWVYASTDLSGTKVTDNYPNGNIFATYSPNNKNQIDLNYTVGKQVPETYQKSPNMLQQDELMWYTGTPELDNYMHHDMHATYTWLPNNRWQLAFSAGYHTSDNRVVPVYTPTGPDGTMLRKYLNNGDTREGNFSLTGTARFLKGRLIARLSPTFDTYRTTGDYSQTLNNFHCTAQLTWYFGNFYLFGWYSSPISRLSRELPYMEKLPTRYQIQFGWGEGAWKASATAYNFLRSNWETSRRTLTSQYYSSDIRCLGTDQHMRFEFSVTYTFGYGKKVQRGDEVGASEKGKSAILK